MNVLDYIRPEHLQGEQSAIAELIGMEAYLKLIGEYGGEKLFISRIDSIIVANRSALIKAAAKKESDEDIIACFHITKRELDRIKGGYK
ncbi:MAG: hypothetical protein NC084_09835 [Bacteroides sp.]|nr:hypothetical protein [Eubacterium sp.]MCM1419415.1 hypothetical protein [Roseburia sp.]MCM1462998.1 hypothetical protein [Bacteroides sp.]